MKEIYDPTIYKNIPYDDLLMAALYSLVEKKIESNFENLVVECFILFPQRFGLPGYYNKYPDSSQVEKSWLRCRTDKGLITGNKAHGFQITTAGLEVVQKTQKILGKKFLNPKEFLAIKGDRRTRTGRLVMQLEKNKIYQNFIKNGDKIEISDYDFCDLIYSTLDTLPETRRNNLKELKNAVIDYNRKDMLEFLNFCEFRFSHLLFAESELNKNYAGGMHKRKINRK